MKTSTWKEFWNVLGTSNDPIAATDRPTVHPETYQLYSIEIIEKLRLNQDDILLDIGCGTGIIDAHLSPYVCRLVATDFSEVMSHKTKSNTAAYENVDTVVCDSVALPFQDSAFSKVVMYAVAQYLSPFQIDQMLGEAHRVARTGGTIMMGEVPRARDTRLFNRIRDIWAHEGPKGVLRKALRNLLEIWLRLTGRWTHRFVRPGGPSITLHSDQELLELTQQHDMRGRVLSQRADLPWFHQTFDLMIENLPVTEETRASS